MKKILITTFIIFMSLITLGCSKIAKVNQTVNIKRDNIKMTVLGSEDVVINNEGLSLSNGEYTKVKLSIENYGNKTFKWSLINFMLGDNTPSIKAVAEDDFLKAEIEAGKTVTGYLYFTKTNETKLSYVSTNIAHDEKGNITTTKEVFKIK